MDARLIQQQAVVDVQKEFLSFEVNLKVAVDYIENIHAHPNLYWMSGERLRTNPNQLVSQLFQTQSEAKEILNAIRLRQLYPQLNQFYNIFESNQVKGQFRIVVNLVPFIKTLQQLKKLTAIKKFLNLILCSSSPYQWQISSAKTALTYMQPCIGYLSQEITSPSLGDVTQLNAKVEKFGFTPAFIAEFKKNIKRQIEKVGTLYFIEIEDEKFLEELFKLAIAANVLYKNLSKSTTHALLNTAFANMPHIAKRKWDEINFTLPKLNSMPKEIAELIGQYLSLVDICNIAKVCTNTSETAKECFIKGAEFRTGLGLFSTPMSVPITQQAIRADSPSLLKG